MRYFTSVLALLFIFLFTSCDTPDPLPAKPRKELPKRKSPSAFAFSFQKSKDWFRSPEAGKAAAVDIIQAVNRIDLAHAKLLDSLLVPQDLSGDIGYYLPFPMEVSALEDVDKIAFFSYPTQSFAAYENGQLVYAGPTNMGRKKDPTPPGLYFTNWKAEQTTSTFNDEWDLKWNFNIENKEGIGWHQYELPGYPASHSCLRLTEKDARYLYTWADEWKIKGTDNILAKGTPVIVFGSYDFDGPKPWLKLAVDPHALDISKSEIEKIAAPYMQEIRDAQEKRRLQNENK